MKTSLIKNLSRSTLVDLVSKCDSYSAIARMVGGNEAGGWISYLKRRLKEEKIDTSVIDNNWCKFISKATFKLVTYDQLLVKDSKHKISSHTKNRMIKDGLLLNKCYICGLPPVWNSKPLTLQVDHIDGDRFNNEIINLRLACPNCHTQTPTHSVAKDIPTRPHNYCHCGKKISRDSSECIKCAHKNPDFILNRIATRKFEISAKELQSLVDTKPISIIGKQFGVSGTAIKKRCRKLGIAIPKQSFHRVS